MLFNILLFTHVYIFFFFFSEKGQKPKAKKQKGSDESAFEESDDGDEEGRELDYISDSSDRFISLLFLI